MTAVNNRVAEAMKKPKIICPTCRQDMDEPPMPGLRGKDCKHCGQGLSWRKEARRKAKLSDGGKG